MSDQPVTAEDFNRMLGDALKAQAQEPQRQARAEFIAQQQARPIDGLDGVPESYFSRIGNDPARWQREARLARLAWLADTKQANSAELMELGVAASKPARETPTTTLTLKDHLPGGGGGPPPNRAA